MFERILTEGMSISLIFPLFYGKFLSYVFTWGKYFPKLLGKSSYGFSQKVLQKGLQPLLVLTSFSSEPIGDDGL